MSDLTLWQDSVLKEGPLGLQRRAPRTLPPRKRQSKTSTLPSFDLASNICTEADRLLPSNYVPISHKRMDEIRNYRWEKGLRAISRSMMARQSTRPVSSQRQADKESKRLEELGIKKPGLTAEDLAALPTSDVYKNLSSLSLISVDTSRPASSSVRSPPRSGHREAKTEPSSSSMLQAEQAKTFTAEPTREHAPQPYAGQGVGRKETCKEESDSDIPPWADSKKSRSSQYTGAGVGQKEAFVRQPPPPPSPPARQSAPDPGHLEGIARLTSTEELQVVNLTQAPPPPREFLNYPVHQGVIVLPAATVQARVASKKEQDKGKAVIHSFPYSYPQEFPLELDVHVQIRKSQDEQVSMILKLNRTASMKGVARAVYNFKGGEFYSVFKLSVVAPQEEQAQDGLQAHEAELDLAHVFPEMVPTVANVFAIQLRVASAVNPLDFPKSPTPSEVSSWRGDSGPPKYLLIQQAYGIMVEKVQPLDNLPPHLRPSMDECYLLILLVLKSALLGYYVRDCGWSNLGRRISPDSSTDLPFFLALDTSAWHKRTPPAPQQATTSTADHVRGLFSTLEYLAEDRPAIQAAKQAFTHHQRQVPPLVQHFFSLLRTPVGKEKAERIFKDTSLALSADVWDAFS